MALELNADVSGSGPPLLLLHGLFGSATNWRSIARTLSDRLQVHALDLRNHGASPWADTMGYEEMADDVAAYIASRGLDTPSVLGHSMGGKAAMALALRRPERVGHLIVADIAPVDYDQSLAAYAEAMRSIDVAAAASRTEIQRRLQERLPDPSVAGFLAQNLVNRDDHFDWRINLAAIIAEMPRLSAFPASLRRSRYDGPVTVIAGGRSSYVAHPDGRDFTPLFPRATVEVIAEAGHWVHAERPQEFVAIVRRALDAGRH